MNTKSNSNAGQSENLSDWYLVVRTGFVIVLSLIVLIVGMIAVVVATILTLGRAQNFITSEIGKLLGRSILAIAGIELKVEQVGEPVDQPAIYIANHSSTLDMFVIVALGLPRIRFVAKYEFLYNPIFFILGKCTGQLFIKRRDSAQAIETLNRALETIRKKRLSLLFMPEGTRRTDGQIGPFKKGAFRMAMELDYPIVPMHFIGMRKLASGRSLVVRPGPVLVRIYPPIDTSQWTDESMAEHIDAIRTQYVQWEHAVEQTNPANQEMEQL